MLTNKKRSEYDNLNCIVSHVSSYAGLRGLVIHICSFHPFTYGVESNCQKAPGTTQEGNTTNNLHATFHVLTRYV